MYDRHFADVAQQYELWLCVVLVLVFSILYKKRPFDGKSNMKIEKKWLDAFCLSYEMMIVFDDVDAQWKISMIISL